jgi:hypothetical protein
MTRLPPTNSGTLNSFLGDEVGAVRFLAEIGEGLS